MALEDGNAGEEGRKSEHSPIITGICLNDFCLIIPAISGIPTIACHLNNVLSFQEYRELGNG